MSKILLNLDDFRSQGLDELAYIEKTSKTGLLKEGLDLLFKSRKYVKPDSLSAYFGAWSHKAEDGLEYQHKIRDEWDR